MEQFQDALVVLLGRQFYRWSGGVLYRSKAGVGNKQSDGNSTGEPRRPQNRFPRRRDDVYFASSACFMASPAYCLHLSCMPPEICAQRLKASAASLNRLMFCKSAPRMKKSV